MSSPDPTLLEVLQIAVPRMAHVAARYGDYEDIKAFLKLLRLLEKLTNETQ